MSETKHSESCTCRKCIDVQIACEWAEYRKEYSPPQENLNYVYMAFKSGFHSEIRDAITGETSE